jgi:hypothetical protein
MFQHMLTVWPRLTTLLCDHCLRLHFHTPFEPHRDDSAEDIPQDSRSLRERHGDWVPARGRQRVRYTWGCLPRHHSSLRGSKVFPPVAGKPCESLYTRHLFFVHLFCCIRWLLWLRWGAVRELEQGAHCFFVGVLTCGSGGAISDGSGGSGGMGDVRGDAGGGCCSFVAVIYDIGACGGGDSVVCDDADGGGFGGGGRGCSEC